MGPGTGNGRGAGLGDRCTGAWKSVHSSDPLQSLLGAWAKLSTEGPRRVVRGKAGGLGQVARGWLRNAGSGENKTRDYRRTASWPGHALPSWGPGALPHSPSAPHMLLPSQGLRVWKTEQDLNCVLIPSLFFPDWFAGSEGAEVLRQARDQGATPSLRPGGLTSATGKAHPVG